MIAPLLIKEIKDTLRDPRILVPFILSALIMPVIALVISLPMRFAIQEAVQGVQNIGIINLDSGPYSKLLEKWLTSRGFKLTPLRLGDSNQLYSSAASEGLKVILIIPGSFSKTIEEGKPLNVTLVSIIDEISFMSGVETTAVTDSLKTFYLDLIANRSQVDPEVLKNPVITHPQTYISSKGTLLPSDPTSLFGLLMAALFIPLIVMSIAMVVMQMSATSMAVENEEKTLETLLTMPVPPRDILTAKLLGMFIVSLIGSLFEIIGIVLYFIIYFATFLPAIPTQASEISLPSMPQGFNLFRLPDLALLAPSLLISLFFAAALGVVIGALSRDVRIANTMMSPISMLVVLPGYLVVFAPSKFLGPILKAIFYIFPLTQPTILAKDIVSSRPPLELPLYLLLSVIFTLLLVYATSRLLSLETLSRIQSSIERIASKLKRKS